jgi:hypothetical protein
MLFITFSLNKGRYRKRTINPVKEFVAKFALAYYDTHQPIAASTSDDLETCRVTHHSEVLEGVTKSTTNQR